MIIKNACNKKELISKCIHNGPFFWTMGTFTFETLLILLYVYLSGILNERLCTLVFYIAEFVLLLK